DESSSAGHDNHEIHHEQHQVVVPAVSAPSPKADLPYEDLLLYRTEHEEDQPDGGELNQDAERHAYAAQNFGAAEKDRKPGARLDALRPLGGVPEVIPPTIEEDDGDHESQQQQAGVVELQQGGEREAHVRSPSGRRGWRRSRAVASSMRPMYARTASACARRGTTK